MGWLRTIISASWFPYAAIGGLVIVTTAFGWGYMKGYSDAESDMKHKINKALKEQMKENQRQSKKDFKSLEEAHNAEQGVEDAIENITLPDIDPACSAAFVKWMRTFNNAVRASAANTGSTD